MQKTYYQRNIKQELLNQKKVKEVLKEKKNNFNKIILPKTMLLSGHAYYAPNVSDRGYMIDYAINPELHGAPETLYADENKSEYHRNNIEKYPEKQKLMFNWTKDSAKRHQEFELRLRAKGRHKLSFGDLGL